ncbi:MAG: phosphodiester glycosidase family protein [Alistipes sp.]|nr:phosphodiester glycosidase family protein [Alistipes sp.]
MKQILLLLTAFFISCSVSVPHNAPVTTIAKGVDILQQDYEISKGGERLLTKLFIFDVTLSNRISLKATTADDSNTAIAPISKQLEMMQRNNKQIKVLGGVNSDFFHIKSSNMICGVMYRNGECLKGSYDDQSTIFALLKNGTAVCVTSAEYEVMDKSLILEAVSGRQMLVNDNVAQSSESKTFHPRTAVGVTKDGKRVFILVADGRRKGYSNGLAYADMVAIFKKLGAYDALNLDGGGSSCFSINAGRGKFAPLNRPSDKSGERAVPNGIAVIYRR